MRKIVIEKTVYQFDELADKAKENAREWYRHGIDFEFHSEFILDEAKIIGELLGINIKNIFYSGFSSQGDGACFTGRYSPKPEALETIKREFPGDEDLLNIALQLKESSPLTAIIEHRGRYCHEGNMEITCYNGDDETDENKVEAIEEALRDFARWIYKRLESEFFYVNSDESIDENIRINEYEFEESGKRA